MANDSSQTPQTPQPPKTGPAKPTLRVQVKKPALGDLGSKFSKFRPKSPKYRWWLLFGGFALVGIVVSSMSDSSGPKPVQAQKKADFISLTPQGSGQKTWQAQAQGQVVEMKHQMTALQDQISQLKQGMQAQTKALESATQAIQSAKISAPTAGTSANNPGSTNDSSLPLPPPPPMPTTPTIPDSAASGYTPPAGKILEYSPTAAAAHKVLATTSYHLNKYAGFIPVGSFMPVVLLNGVDAGTSTETQSNPQPVLMRVQANAVLPGNASYQLKSCFVLGSAYGSLSSERVYIRSAMLSCVNKQNRLVLNQKIQGYVIDSDGVLGLRGKVINRQGALLAKALLAGFASGLGQALNSAQGTVSSSALGSVSTVTGTGLLSQAGYSGAGNAATLLAQFYLKQAQAIFPVVAIRAGRKATLVIGTGTSLKWHNYGSLYVTKVVPKK
ncbi:hypothetical protein A6M27_16995 [Acidithiobacillus thiooxidans]|uniref:Conjugal transfer protein TraB n=3 Tax=Acidithiobacillus thiooxidans TaxID=930 RepID=A0A1C2HY57_ACITH|nr:TrbI/VirB10 family protein [Acidithiobacillus thiooxidans]OCX68691.1 hypothetical protein A6P07_17705 [Acidithiobacillus thiooxidans]OCX81047.1 hypothetical protein A6O26_13725 [Acidithiobacillus thiooxidans]OCX83791.1 hypothetical protein A6M27_16995 [Acidithiobacillus thiooxidans]OFC50277.1 hypothetical protein BAE47_02980 [Acidithiobacillus thiooxidans]